MEREKIILRQKEILKKLEEDFKKVEDVVDYVQAKEGDGFDSVVVEHEDLGIGNDTVIGQYFFLPDELENNVVQRFQISITISDELEEKKKVDMLQAIAMVNYLLPSGAFGFDPTIEILSYKRGVTLMAEAEQEDAIAMIGYEMMTSLHMVSLFTAPLLAFMYDEITWDEFLQACELAVDAGKSE